MAGVKDRTLEFLKEVELTDTEVKQGNKKMKRPPKIKLKNMKKNALLKQNSGEKDSDLSKFLTLVSKTRELLEEMKSAGQLINSSSIEIVNSPFQDEAKRARVEDLIASMKSNTKIVNADLRRMKDLINSEEGQLQDSKIIPNDLRIRRTQYFVMVNDFRDTLNSFHNDSANCRTQCLSSIQNRLSITGCSKTAEEVEDLMEKGNWSIFTEGLLMDTQVAKDQLAQLESRCKFILEIETAVTELHDMFIQLGNLVETQGELVDSIESQVKNTHDYIETAQNQLEEARKSRKRARRCKIITGVVVTVVVIVVCVAVFI